MRKKKYDDPKEGVQALIKHIKKRLRGRKAKSSDGRLERMIHFFKAEQRLGHVPSKRSALVPKVKNGYEHKISAIKSNVAQDFLLKASDYEKRKDAWQENIFKEEVARAVARGRELEKIFASLDNISQIKLCEISNFCEDLVILNKIVTLALGHFLRDEKDAFIMNCYLTNFPELEFEENFYEIIQVAKVDDKKRIILFVEAENELNSLIICPEQQRYLVGNSIAFESDKEEDKYFEDNNIIVLPIAEVETKFGREENSIIKQVSANRVICNNNTNDLMGFDHLANAILNFYCNNDKSYNIAKICEKISEILGKEFKFDKIDDVVKALQNICDEKFADRKYQVWKNILSAAAIKSEQSLASAPALPPDFDYMMKLLDEICKLDKEGYLESEQNLFSAAYTSLLQHGQRISFVRSQIYPTFEISDELKQKYLSIKDVADNQNYNSEAILKFLQNLSQFIAAKNPQDISRIDESFALTALENILEDKKRKDPDLELSPSKAARLEVVDGLGVSK